MNLALPQPPDHQLLLFFPHADAEEGADLTQGGQKSHRVLHRGLADRVGSAEWSCHLTPKALVLAVQQREDSPDQLRVLHLALLAPAHHRLRDQLFEGL